MKKIIDIRLISRDIYTRTIFSSIIEHYLIGKKYFLLAYILDWRNFLWNRKMFSLVIRKLIYNPINDMRKYLIIIVVRKWIFSAVNIFYTVYSQRISFYCASILRFFSRLHITGIHECILVL